MTSSRADLLRIQLADVLATVNALRRVDWTSRVLWAMTEGGGHPIVSPAEKQRRVSRLVAFAAQVNAEHQQETTT